MATYVRLPSSSWRAFVRRKGKSASKSFRLKADADRWAHDQEDKADRSETISSKRPARTETLGDFIRIHMSDYAEVEKAVGRSKQYSLETLDRDLGHLRPADLTRERLIGSGRARHKEGAGPVTIGADFGYINTVLLHAAAIHGIEAPIDHTRLARVALGRLALVGNVNRRAILTHVVRA